MNSKVGVEPKVTDMVSVESAPAAVPYHSVNTDGPTDEMLADPLAEGCHETALALSLMLVGAVPL